MCYAGRDWHASHEGHSKAPSGKCSEAQQLPGQDVHCQIPRGQLRLTSPALRGDSSNLQVCRTKMHPGFRRRHSLSEE